MVCKNCGFTNEAESKFCSSCGTALTAPVVEPVADTYANQAEAYTAPVQNSAPVYNAPYQAPVYTAPAPAPVQEPGKGFSIAGMVCGIVSLLCIGAPITNILGIVFGAVAKSKGCKNGMATAGIACGAVGLGLWLFWILFAALASITF